MPTVRVRIKAQVQVRAKAQVKVTVTVIVTVWPGQGYLQGFKVCDVRFCAFIILM